ncbi:membrane-bound alpha-1,6- mannosyltransferase Initiation-specific [Arachnomyces sp. PD_36]|nr:membrane-bound alpha-1,6- mannosyltransferase Initiation-specific [Arachnomyces sp. PD_36]
MISFRRSLIAAALFLTLFIILRSSHSSNPKSPISASTGPGAHNEPSSGETVLDSQSGKPPPKQQPLEDLSRLPLREKLRYQFPYDLGAKFPAYIWQTWKYAPSSSKFDDDLRPFEASWTNLHPGFVHEVLTDETAKFLIRYLYASVPEVQEAYNSLPLPVLKADFFRYLILLARGGIYSDIDTIALQPALNWLPSSIDRSSVGLVVGIEADADRPDWKDWYSRRLQLCQWTIQAKRGHPVLRDVVATITEDTLRMKRAGILTESKMDKTIVEFTGPGTWTDAVFGYFNNPDYFDLGQGDSRRNISAQDFTGITAQKKMGDVVVLPITGFSPGVYQMGSEDIDHPMAFVKHEFEGTWKPESERTVGLAFDDFDM